MIGVLSFRGRCLAGLVCGLCLLMSAALAQEGLREPYEIDDGFASRGRIDELVLASQKEKGIKPAYLCSDAVFLRRVYIDLTGTVPTALEAREFLQDHQPLAQRRAYLLSLYPWIAETQQTVRPVCQGTLDLEREQFPGSASEFLLRNPGQRPREYRFGGGADDDGVAF
ncbi:MAG: DUF1549 domain-containing protein [Candidatus Sumerlaeota bacterium]